MGKRKGKRRKGIKWEYNFDGCFSEEKYNSFDKRYWRRYWRREGQREIKRQAKDIQLNEYRL